MQIEQISVFMENKSGSLADVMAVLWEADIGIKAMILADLSDFGVLRMIVDDAPKAKEHLKHQGFVVNSTPVFTREFDRDSMEIHQVLASLNRAGVNVEYMYAFVQQSGNSAVLIFRFDRTAQGIELLQKNNITTIPGEKLYAM